VTYSLWVTATNAVGTGGAGTAGQVTPTSGLAGTTVTASLNGFVASATISPSEAVGNVTFVDATTGITICTATVISGQANCTGNPSGITPGPSEFTAMYAGSSGAYGSVTSGSYVAPSPYTVTFDPNGGTGTMAPQTNDTPTVLTLNSYTNGSLTFIGWTTNADGSGTPFADGSQYAFTSDITLFAQWQ
jgi:hypothetical protein